MHCIGRDLVQQALASINGRIESLELPNPDAVIWPGLRWGRYERPLSPAFWVYQAWMAAPEREADYRLGRSFIEEVVYCLLGGHGASAEIGLAASTRVCTALAQRACATLPDHELEDLLRQPLLVNGRSVHYRFAAQRARYLAGTLSRLSELDEERMDDIALRDALRELPGIGPKTASWVVRNRRASDHVAILDVHIVRACALLGVFPQGADPARQYLDLEHRFLSFCAATQSRASAMDAVMWATMRNLSRRLLHQLVGAEVLSAA